MGKQKKKKKAPVQIAGQRSLFGGLVVTNETPEDRSDFNQFQAIWHRLNGYKYSDSSESQRVAELRS